MLELLNKSNLGIVLRLWSSIMVSALVFSCGADAERVELVGADERHDVAMAGHRAVTAISPYTFKDVLNKRDTFYRAFFPTL